MALGSTWCGAVDAMPSPSAVDGADDGEGEGKRVEDREEAGSQRTSEKSWERRGWSEEEWRQWNSFYVWGGGGTQANASSSVEGSAAPTPPHNSQIDPWWTSQSGDPWMGGGGGHDKIQVLRRRRLRWAEGKGYIRKLGGE